MNVSRLLVTGAAGFIGSNAVARFSAEGVAVTALDDFSREGAERNAAWLEEEHDVDVDPVDVRDRRTMTDQIRRFEPDGVLHLAAQTAVTTSLEDPRDDAEVNIEGTLNVLEAVRRHAPEAHVVFASTNKVYGELRDEAVEEGDTRYRYRDLSDGVDERRPLDFRTPYGVSKGAADQYVLDWARTFGLKTTTLRQSCIYGPRQVGVEAQGWVAWFVRAALAGRTITIYGDGKQVRDLLYVDDLVELFGEVLAQPEVSSGEAFNVGGGQAFSLSLLELLDLLEDELGRRIEVTHDDWREGDQRVFYCATEKARDRLGWEPRTPPAEGVRGLIDWVERTPWLLDDL